VSDLRPTIDFTRGPSTPSFDTEHSGVVIRVEHRASHGVIEALTLHGAYRIDVDTAREIRAVPLQRALVVVVTAGLWYAAWNLAREALLFEDDEETRAGMVRGYFNVDLRARGEVPRAGVLYVLVSMGPVVSNVVEIRLAR